MVYTRIAFGLPPNRFISGSTYSWRAWALHRWDYETEGGDRRWGWRILGLELCREVEADDLLYTQLTEED